MTKSDPYHNSYTCPNCEEDVPCALPLAKFVECPECKTKLEIMVDAEFDNGSWHDLTQLSIAEECCPECRSERIEREHKQRMIDHAKDVEECEHQYREHTTAPLGVSCIKCGKFVGAWE